MEVLWLQSHPFRHEGKSWGQAKPKHWHAISGKLSEIPLVLSPKQVKLGLTELKFRGLLIVLLEGTLGIRQGELGAIRGLECDFENMSYSVPEPR